MTQGVVAHYARIRTSLEKTGKPIGNKDLSIASHAVSEGYVVVTNNVKHLSHVPGLRVELWQ